MTRRPFAWMLAAILPLAGCNSAPPHSTVPSTPPAVVQEKPAHKLLLVSIDGLRADALDRGITPNLQRIIDGGVRAKWMTPSYPSLTFPNHYTLVTGLRPDHHGIIHNSMDVAELGPFKLSDAATVTKVEWWGGEPIWVSAEQAGVRTATWSWPGSEAEIKGIRPSQWRRYDESIALEARADSVLGWLRRTDVDAPRLATLYLETVDKAGHRHGPESAEYIAAVKQADAVVGLLLDGLQQHGLSADTNVVVVSDHGMAPVAPGQVVATEDMADPRLARNISTGQSIGFEPVEGQQAAAEAALLGRHAHYQCWKKQDLPARWHYGSNPRIPSIICQMDEGWDALSRERIARRSHEDRGSHGYDNALPSMRAVFIARGPSFKQGKVIAPFDNVDVYPLLARLLQVPAAANDGDAERLLDALR
ncbi:ectonucleotide pyrophosphatase/phosphodiesterase [Stenotrophomonas sp. CFBP8980]|uniref:alkaline phosphatase family protein n=1 Tax=Stenotrophomonas sp. CFBP8980 TaxID=3096523 RepID=UPI002A69CFB0|nr:ectonucleotide pyrophosphatase/phosphodiesterase [Stenotrophomonas sp. CFBP8980]MDY1034826.1 ectonucleotide pyrophosphatase/phosphodiesterase [Stenotrophomonas sp. CFBP8980]